MSYTNIFGGYNINTAFPSYASYTFASNLQLNWASSFVDTAQGTNNVTAQINDLNATNANLTVTLADATLISVGQSIQLNNLGANSITINDFLGGQLAVIPTTATSNQYILYLQNNTTQDGTWGITQLGAGTSQANANALAGLGTISLNNQINTNFPGKTIGTNYQVLDSDRGSILVWTGGAGTITLVAQLAGFYIAVNNEGSGIVTINTPDSTTIDGNASFSLNPSESSYIIGVGANWNTLGFGVESFFAVNVLSPLDLSTINPSITLTNQQASRLVHQYSGTLANNVIVYYPAAAGQWYIWNNTSGAFTVTAQLVGPTGNTVVIPQGQKVILYSDGTSMYNTPTISTSAVFPDGTVGSPGINFQAQGSTGFYRISSGLTGYASAGTQGVTLGGPTPGYGLGISGGLASRYYNAANTQYVGFKGGALTGNTIWTLPLTDSTGTQFLVSNGSGTLSWSQPVTSVSGTTNRISVTSPTTTPVIDISASYVGQASITTLGTIGTGTWQGTPITVTYGGTGLNTLTTAYGVVCAGTTATGNLQNAGAGTANQVFTSNGAAALPSWKNINIALPAAVKADQITGTSTTVYTNPAVQQFHASASKFWCMFDGTVTGTNPPVVGYNVTSVQRISQGLYQINFTSSFTSNNYCINITSTPNTGANGLVPALATVNANFFNFHLLRSTNSVAEDTSYICASGFGTQ